MTMVQKRRSTTRNISFRQRICTQNLQFQQIYCWIYTCSRHCRCLWLFFRPVRIYTIFTFQDRTGTLMKLDGEDFFPFVLQSRIRQIYCELAYLPSYPSYPSQPSLTLTPPSCRTLTVLPSCLTRTVLPPSCRSTSFLCVTSTLESSSSLSTFLMSYSVRDFLRDRLQLLPSSWSSSSCSFISSCLPLSRYRSWGECRSAESFSMLLSMMQEWMAQVSLRKGWKSSSYLEVQSLLMASILLRLSLRRRFPRKCSQSLPKPSHFMKKVWKEVREVQRKARLSSLQYASSTRSFFRYRFLMVMNPSTSNRWRMRVQAERMFSSTISSQYLGCLYPTSIEDSSSENSRNCLNNWKGLRVCLRMADRRISQIMSSGGSYAYSSLSSPQRRLRLQLFSMTTRVR